MRPLHCTASMADQGTALAFVMLTESFKGPLVKKACGRGSILGWAGLKQAGPGSGDLELGSFYGF